MADAPVRPERVLVMCTANQCRSPLGAALLRRRAAERGLAIEVLSAGLGESGHPATEPTVAAAALAGIDLRGHRSRTVTPELLAGSDLLVTMERMHVREAVVLHPDVWRTAFTLPDLVRRAEKIDPRPEGESLRVYCGILGAGRDRSAVMGSSPDDDVRDPTVDAGVDHDVTLATIDDLVTRMLARLWPGVGA